MTGWREQALHDLRGAGFRAGAARRAVVDVLAGERCCLSAQDIHDRLRASGRRVGIASVYRALDLLVDRRLVHRVDVGEGGARFEASWSAEHHHHLVCGDCGRIEAFSDESLERAIHGIADRVRYAIDGHEVVLRGACADCRNG